MRYQSTVQLLMRQWFRLFLSYHVIKLDVREHVLYPKERVQKLKYDDTFQR